MEWESIFTNSFELAKNYFTEYYGNKNPDEITPAEHAILTGLNKLPFPVKIIDVSVDNQKYVHLQDNICQLIYYDLSKIGKNQVEYCDKVSSNKEALMISLVDNFGISENDSRSIVDSITKNFEYTGFPLSNESYIQFTRYDIKRHLDEFYDDFRHLFTNTFNDYFIRHYNTEKKTDFNLLYSLKSDIVLSPLDLLMPDSRTMLSMEKLQSFVADIQLSPKIPESVKEEFQRAKDLFVFSYFKYDFITLSIRSALFAYESAMKLRYVQSLDGKAIIKYHSEIVHEFINPSYSEISNFIYHMKKIKNWQLKHVRVNDKKFPLTVKSVMTWLIDNGIPKWKFQLYHAASQLRNSMAHPERQIILSVSDVSLLRNIAYDVNEMFEK